MTTVTAEERALARAAIYRLLAVTFSYPTAGSAAAIATALDVAATGSELWSETADAVNHFAAAVAGVDDEQLEATYQRSFTLSYSEDCPMYETAFSARHLFQQTQQLADLAGFYKAFGVVATENRPDHISLELEFCYLLAVKEATALAINDEERVDICRDAQRSFLRDHLARWAPLFSGRVEVTAAGTLFSAAAKLLRIFVANHVAGIGLEAVEPYRDEPAPPSFDPGDMTCPLAEEAGVSLEKLFADREVQP